MANLKLRQKIERLIVGAAVRELLEAGFTVDVDDGDSGYFITDSRDGRAIMRALFQMDDDRIFVRGDRSTDQPRGGWLYFVYGNDGWDVLSDYTTNLEPYLVRTQRLAAQLEERWG